MTAEPAALRDLLRSQRVFWQGDPQRRHVRLRYRRAGSAWTRQLLWP